MECLEILNNAGVGITVVPLAATSSYSCVFDRPRRVSGTSIDGILSPLTSLMIDQLLLRAI